ncbi:MAG TPA: DUF1080 domain-containing protein [Candidatus Hydrogenedentes bacterium]|nr:DUF1080 domain-containing protein [Candidatus Hydrogenedentota bacterium]
MKNRVYFLVLMIFAAAVVHFSGCATAITYGKDDFKVVSGVLKRGDKDFSIKAFQVPALGACEGKVSLMAPTLVRIAEVGGNVVCFDLAGFSGDGKSLDPKALETVNTLATRAKDQRMGVMVRILGAHTDVDFCKNAVNTAAQALKNQGMAIYYFDGPDAAKYAKEFSKLAPGRLTAAPKNGDIEVVSASPASAPDHPVLVVSAIPKEKTKNVHFLLEGKEEDYAALDAALTNPVEKAPWTPDNSLLSEAEQKDGFISLFDGKTLNGWWVWGGDTNGFRVSPEGWMEWVKAGGEAIYTRDRYDNFILRLEFKLKTEGSNSGVFLRAPREARQSKIGMEFQIMGDHGKAPDNHTTGAVYDQIPPKVNAAKPAGQWNTLEIIFNGPMLKATLNGKVVQDLNFDENEELKYRLRRGFIGLQDHAHYVAFRNIRVKKL